MTVSELFRRYLDHSRAVGLHSAEALKEREYLFALFTVAHGDLPAADCKPFHLTDFIAAHRSWRSTVTKRAKANMIRAAFNWALEEERIDRNPFHRVRYQSAPPRPAVTDAVLQAVCDLANKPFERAVKFLRLTGCRASELCALTWADVDLDKGFCVIRRHKTFRYSGRAKLVVLVADAAALLRHVRSKQPADYAGEVFLNSQRRPWTRRTLGQSWSRLCKANGIDSPGSIHGLRHAFASSAIANGASVKLISEALGHASTAITEAYYCHLGVHAVDAIRAEMEKGKPREE